MRPAAEIVETLAREVNGSCETLDAIERRSREFGMASVRAPEDSIEKLVAAAIAVKLRQTHDALAVTRFKL